jgi:hypothetical protein
MQENAKREVQKWLAGVEVGEGIHHQNLTVFPLFWQDGRADATSGEALDEADNGGARYQLLSDAVESAEAVVEEVSEGGQVPFLGVKNTGGTPILIPEGEILMGAKQNRVVNLTVLVAAKASFKLPVSCVEQGRWHYRSRDFKPAAFAHPKLRELKVKSAQRSRRFRGEALADQGRVWDEVGEHLHALAAYSPTADFAASFDAAPERMDRYRKRIELPHDACGFIAARDGRVVGLDLFDKPQTMRKMWKRMADAYFLESAREWSESQPVARDTAKKFISDVTDHLEEAERQPDLGVEFEVLGEELSGSALFYDGAVCHLSAFNSPPA